MSGAPPAEWNARLSWPLPIVLVLTHLFGSGGTIAGVATPAPHTTLATAAGEPVSGPLTGSAFDLLLESASSDLPFIAFEPGVIADGPDFGLVVVHGSGETVSDVEVTVIVRDRCGMEIDTFHDLGFTPDLIEPGSMAIATAVALDDRRDSSTRRRSRDWNGRQTA